MAEDHRLHILDDIRIASPCPMRWEQMTGDDRVRFCGECRMNVYNLSSMSRGEAERFLATRLATGERLCGAMYRRADGTLITRDCPVGLRAVRRRTAAAARRVAAAVALLLAATAALAVGGSRSPRSAGLRAVDPFGPACRWLNPARPAPPPTFVAGEICPPPPAGSSPATGGADDPAAG